MICFLLILPKTVFSQFTQSENLGFVSYKIKNNWCVLEASRVKEKLADGIEERKHWGPREAVVVLHMLDRESSKQRCGQVLIC